MEYTIEEIKAGIKLSKERIAKAQTALEKAAEEGNKLTVSIVTVSLDDERKFYDNLIKMLITAQAK